MKPLDRITETTKTKTACLVACALFAWVAPACDSETISDSTPPDDIGDDDDGERADDDDVGGKPEPGEGTAFDDAFGDDVEGREGETGGGHGEEDPDTAEAGEGGDTGAATTGIDTTGDDDDAGGNTGDDDDRPGDDDDDAGDETGEPVNEGRGCRRACDGEECAGEVWRCTDGPCARLACEEVANVCPNLVCDNFACTEPGASRSDVTFASDPGGSLLCETDADCALRCLEDGE